MLVLRGKIEVSDVGIKVEFLKLWFETSYILLGRKVPRNKWVTLEWLARFYFVKFSMLLSWVAELKMCNRVAN